uniref:Uncharacterized protein n=1 Tax=Alexandrium catenella TaxID=2925 RepID=A0A7S1Q2R0_ALECA|mmetsp:Transcript_15899/g.43238  ORF Transcript_15899/g.43238 Transcript_15899/m.43238 type:complete len:404 (+) Transcript_15899:104-1315(+)
MVRLLCLASLLLGRLGFLVGLRSDETDDSEAVRVETAQPWRQKKKTRVVVQPGNAMDPYERASHYDDWVSYTANKYLDLQSPVCVTEVGSSGQRCKLLSQRLCTSESERLPRTDASLGQCFARRRTCAIVGSSAHLLNVSWGDAIDGHDFVIRLNAAPAGSLDRLSPHFPLAPHVGTRTDARFLNLFGYMPDDSAPSPPSCLFLPEPKVPAECGKHCKEHPGLCNVTTCRTPRERGYCTTGTCGVSSMRCLAAAMDDTDHDWGPHHVFLDNLHAGIVDQIVPHSTAGFKAVIYAMSICDHVSVIGFGPSCRGAVGSRYYEGLVGVADTHHYQEELGLLLRASENGTRAIIPPEARAWIAAKNVTVALPDCVKKEAVVLLHQVFQGFGASAAVRLASEGNFMAF